MLNGKIKSTKTKSGGEEIVWVGDEPSTAIEKSDSGSGLKAHHAPDILSAHLCLTAPDRDMVLLPMVGLEFQEDSIKLFNDLAPKNTSQAIIATIAVSLFNASQVCIADGTRRNVPLRVRDSNVNLGIKAGTAVADLLTRFDRLSGSRKSVRVGKVNVEAGGQAIVGNVQSGRERGRRATDGKVKTTLRSHKSKRRIRSASAEIKA